MKEIEEIEKCIVCHNPTIYRKDTSIDDRRYYVYGVGQLCKGCYYEIYKEKDDKHDNTMD